MKKLEECLLLFEEAKKSKIEIISELELLEKIKEANSNKKITDEGGLCRLIINNNRDIESKFNLIKSRVDDSNNDELKREFQFFINKINDYKNREKPICKYCGYEAKSKTDLSRHKEKSHPEFYKPRQKLFYDVDYDTKIQRLKEVIERQEEEILTWIDIKSMLHINWGDNIKKVEETCKKVSPEALQLFNTIKEKINLQISNVEQWFYNVLVEKFDDVVSNDNQRIEQSEKDKLSNYKKYVSLSNLRDKEILSGNKSIGGKEQDIDILITFKDGPQKYNGVSINGIGISCEGERYHKYLNDNNKLSYNKTVANDFLRYGNKTYFIIPWDEKEKTKGYSKKKIKERASKFIDNFILNVLSSIFYGTRPIYNPTQHQKQDQDKKLKEIADALHSKIGKFEYNGEHGKLEINDLGTYFLFNKYNLSPQPGRDYIWSSVFKSDFVLDDDWKSKIYNIIINNEKKVREANNYKKTIDYINKFGKFPKEDRSEFNKRQAAKRFAKLFKIIKKRTSK